MIINEYLYNIFGIVFYVIASVIFLFGVVYNIASYRRKKKEKITEYKLTFLHIKLPSDNEIEIKAAEHMFTNLMGFKGGFWQTLFSGDYRISFEIVSKKEGIGFYVVVPDEIVTIVEKQINAAYPSAEIDIVNPHEIWDRGIHTQVAELKLAGPSYFPIKVYEDLKNDSLSSITSSMSKLGDDEVIAVQYVIQPAPDGWRSIGRKYVSNTQNKAADPEKKVHIDTAFLEGIEKKISQPGFYAKIRLVCISKDKFSAQNHVNNLKSAFEQFTDVKYNKFVLKSGMFSNQKKIVDDFIFRKIKVNNISIPVFDVQLYLDTAILNTVELATAFHFPNKEIGTPNIEWLTARRAMAPANIPTEGLYLGKNTFRGVEKRIYMNREDRTRHFYLIGQTGTGKSVNLMFLALQDIINGEGVAIIDPHGTDIDILLTQIPEERIDDVILFDAADTERPLGINMLEAHSEEEKHMLINAFIALLYKLYDPNRQGIMGPQLERSIRNVMLTAMEDPEATMVDVMRLLIDDTYVKKFLPLIKDPLVKRYWTDEQAKTSANRKGEMMGYIVSKFDRLVTEKLMRNIVGQPKSAFNLEEIMAQKKILLIDLAKGKIGEENSNFLGLLLVPRILSAALARHKLIGKEEFPDFYLYVDEFQNFATPDFATILSEARKYKLNLTVAHQFVSQLPDDIKNAIFGNIGTMCVYRVGTDDAEFLEPYFDPPFTKRDISNLSVGSSYMRLLVDGHPTPPFSLNVDFNEVNAFPKRPEVAQRIRELSRNKYGMPVHEVEEFVNRRAGLDEDEEENALPEIPGFDKSRIPF